MCSTELWNSVSECMKINSSTGIVQYEFQPKSMSVKFVPLITNLKSGSLFYWNLENQILFQDCGTLEIITNSSCGLFYSMYGFSTHHENLHSWSSLPVFDKFSRQKSRNIFLTKPIPKNYKWWKWHTEHCKGSYYSTVHKVMGCILND